MFKGLRFFFKPYHKVWDFFIIFVAYYKFDHQVVFKSKNRNMSNIQDIHAFAERIYDIVQDYVDGNYNADDVLAIGKRCGKITMKADAKEAIKVGKSTELYPLKDLLRKGDDGNLEPDNDKISDIANSWVFLD